MVRERAHALHASVNQHYDGHKPYAVHLDMVAEAVKRHIGQVLADEADRLPVMFGAYFHDSIEDARLTYNNVLQLAAELGLDDRQAVLGAEIVYALTNDKGRTRAERAGAKYYAGIRATPYAAFVKMADRLANTAYSVHHADDANAQMRQVYAAEWPHFLAQLQPDADLAADRRHAVPQSMVAEMQTILNNKQ